MMKMVITDAGRKMYKPGERNDCTVRAFAKLLNITYKESHAFIATMGRTERKGYPLPYWLYCAWVQGAHILGKRLEFRFYQKGLPRYTVAEFIAVKKEGRYMIQVENHVFAVIDGMLYDDKIWDWEKAEVISYFKFV